MLDHTDPKRAAQRELQAMFKESQFLNRLSTEQLFRLTSGAHMKEFPAETTFIEEGTDLQELYFILQGMVAVSLFRSTNPTLWLYVSGPGTVVDLCALLDPPVAPVSAYALTNVQALAIPRSALVAVLEEEPAIGYEIVKHLCTRLSIITRVTVEELSQPRAGPCPN